MDLYANAGNVKNKKCQTDESLYTLYGDSSVFEIHVCIIDVIAKHFRDLVFKDPDIFSDDNDYVIFLKRKFQF